MELVDKNGLTEEEFLKNYRPGDYERPFWGLRRLIKSASTDD